MKPPQKFHENLKKKQIKLQFLKQYFSRKCSFGHVEWSIADSAGNYLAKIQKTFALCPKLQFFQFFSRVFFSEVFFRTRTVQFRNSCQKTIAKNPEYCSLVYKNKVIFFLKGNSFHGKFLLARREQFWQPSRSLYIEYPDKFRPVSESERKTMLFQKLFLMEGFSGQN